jgi:hypothetical protein
MAARSDKPIATNLRDSAPFGSVASCRDRLRRTAVVAGGLRTDALQPEKL